jgi:hypothetical protein
MRAAWVIVLVMWLAAGARPGAVSAQVADAGVGSRTRTSTSTSTSTDTPEEEAPLPAGHEPELELGLEPKKVGVGELLKLRVAASVPVGDDVTLPEQTFGGFELNDKRARVEPAKAGKQRFVFELDLQGFEPGEQELPALQVRVVTKEGAVGSVRTEPTKVSVSSLLANEPNAEPRGPTAPVEVMEDDFTLLYVAYAIGGALAVALLTWLAMRWWQRRERPEPPPPPPRPAWEVAVEKLAELRRKKQTMIEQGQGVEFVDAVSDVVREYLGGRFGFDGLETTSDEMLLELTRRRANVGLIGEVRAYLYRCDLVKFAKVIPDQDEADLVFAKAQDIVRFSTPTHPGAPGAVEPPVAGEAPPSNGGAP